MTEDEFVELVETIDANFPPSDTWANAHRVAGEFKPLDAVEVFAALNDWVMNGEPDRSRYAPAPAWLIRRARDRMRRNVDPTYRAQLPESTGPAGNDLGRWRDENHPGKSWREIIRGRHAELVSAEDCRSPHCDVHREVPEPWPDGFAELF